jgi:hypothetical protein
MISFINTLCKGGTRMNEENQDNDEPDQHNEKEPHYDKNGHLFLKLNLEDSALVVRSDGTIEMVSHDLESSDDGYMGDVEDLSKTFSLVLALVSALENEELYNRIFHNLNMILMKKWEVLDDGTKEMIIEKRKQISNDLSPEEEKEKLQRVDEFRKRMNKYKDTFLEDMEKDKRRLKRDMQDELDWQKKFGRDFGMNPEMKDMDMEDTMETRKKVKKVKRNPLAKLKGVDWNPYDKTLKAHWKPWHVDEPPKLEDDE